MKQNLVERMEHFVAKYATFEDSRVVLPLVLWCLATFLHQEFDTFAYIVITSLTKRSGKTRLSELLGFASNYSVNATALTPSALFRKIDPIEPIKGFVAPTVIFDEAEILSSEAANNMRAILNAGYRKGQVVSRTIGNNVVDFRVYCPKVFVLIGDVFDTLRDRSIVVTMKRSEPKERFSYDAAKAEGKAFAEEFLATLNEEKRAAIAEAYLAVRASYLSDRDEEIWAPVFAMCKVFCPGRYRELERIAVDLCALKSAERRIVKDMEGFETAANQAEYAEKVLADLLKVIGTEKNIFSNVAVDRLKAIDLAPWRTFKGEGLTQNNLADLVAPFGLESKPIRNGTKVLRGYKREHILAAYKKVHGK